MMNWDYTMNGWMAGWMWVPMILVVALLVLGTVAVGRNMSGGGPRQADDPLDIGARRFARGEITKDEFETLRATLKS